MTSKFDMYVGIDWSGAKSPIKSKAIALSWCMSGAKKPEFIDDKLSRQDVADWIIDTCNQGKTMMIGIDCNLGYSELITRQQFGKDFQIDDLWSEVEKCNTQNDNLFAGGFWESRKYNQYFWTHGNQPDWYEQDKLRRQTEKLCKGYGLGHPECPFKLIGPKQVGKGGLSGMRLAHKLTHRLGKKISIWPFHDSYLNPSIALVEIYPRLFLNYCGFENKKIRNIDDLNGILKSFKSDKISSNNYFNDHMCDAIISAAGMRYFIEKLSSSFEDSLYIEEEYMSFAKTEGWIFGVNKKILKKVRKCSVN